MLSKRSLLNVIFAISLLGAGSAHADLIGPVYPAPGGNSLGHSGTQGGPGGGTYTYSGFNTTAFSELYWGADSTSLPAAGLNGTASLLSTISLSGNTLTYSGTTTYFDPTNSTTYSNVPIELQITIGGLTNPWVSFASVNGSDPSAIGFVVNESSGTAFSANLAFLADVNNGGYQAINLFEQPANSSGETKSSFSGAFYSAAPVPLPAAVWLLVSGLGGFIGIFGRRKQSV